MSVLQRPTSNEFADALSAQSTSKCDVNVLPTKLRPVKIEDENDNDNDFEISEESEENIIINLNKLSKMISAFLPHECQRASPSVKVVKRLGLCITVEVFCRNCSFISDAVDLFTTVPSSRGPDAGSLNVCLLIPVDVVQVLSCLNIKSPDRRGLQRRFNRLSDMMVDVNKQRMIDNQTYVKHILQLAGEENLIDVETDSSYNNRPQPGCEAATQTFCPLVEQCTTKKLTINIETANVNCPSKNCEHNVDTCKRNYSTGESMASTESKFVKKHLNTINSQGILKVRSVTSDASAQIMKSVHDYEEESNIPTRHYKCFIHKLRSFQKHFRGIKLTSSLIGCNKDIFMRKLSSNIRSRLRVELIRIKKTTTTEDSFLYRASNAVQNIISCFANDHRNCRIYSLVCNAHLQTYSTKHLPYGKHLELNMNDIVKLNGIIEKHFSETELSKISRLSTTNKCESLHHKVFTFAPKSTIYTRNFAGLCHLAVHSSSLGNGLACIKLAKIIGLAI